MNFSVNYIYTNREEAGDKLASYLEKYKGMNGVVLAIPRGGVPIGCIIAKEIRFKLDLALSKKIGHPLQPEYAIGAVSLTDCFIEDYTEVPKDYIQKEEQRIRERLKEMYVSYMGENTTPVDLKDKIVIITDDGLATGRTMLSTIAMVKKQNPKRLIVAVPVSSENALQRIAREADEVVCPFIPRAFTGVAAFYEDFTQVNDEEVRSYIQEFKNENQEQ